MNRIFIACSLLTIASSSLPWWKWEGWNPNEASAIREAYPRCSPKVEQERKQAILNKGQFITCVDEH